MTTLWLETLIGVEVDDLTGDFRHVSADGTSRLCCSRRRIAHSRLITIPPVGTPYAPRGVADPYISPSWQAVLIEEPNDSIIPGFERYIEPIGVLLTFSGHALSVDSADRPSQLAY